MKRFITLRTDNGDRVYPSSTAGAPESIGTIGAGRAIRTAGAASIAATLRDAPD